ncbi:MAG TPA: hypothetical protein VLH35_06355 [Candidatus Acidoferrales bacterium]|nr:hypothetical protein [Candidatus Acidoferrales bacterium]
MQTVILEKLGSKQLSKPQLFNLVESDFTLLPTLFEGTSSPKASIRYSCGSVLMDLAAKYPDKLYPYMDRFIELLDSKFRILTWNALGAIANLTAADVDCKFDAIFDRYYGFLGSGYMVTVANVVGFSEKIIQNKPYLADRVASELLKVENLQITEHLTEECKLVIAETAIETFDTLMHYTKNKAALIKFAEKHQNSPRTTLSEKAHEFIKKWQ